ncbi:hypothetical protein D3C75_954070 [compost metagenome]
MMRVIMVPTNSSRPKSSSSGSSKPAKMKTENSTGSRSCSTRPPVAPERSTSGPASKKVSSTKRPPSTRTQAQKGETLNRLLRKGRLTRIAGLNNQAINVISMVVVMMALTMATR